MSATDELRLLLNARGVVWRDNNGDTEFCDVDGRMLVAWDAGADINHMLTLTRLTPYQAVEIALGREKCKFEIKDNCNDSEGTQCDVWFECSGCHARFDYYADEWLMQENYCPVCGRKVEYELLHS